MIAEMSAFWQHNRDLTKEIKISQSIAWHQYRETFSSHSNPEGTPTESKCALL